MTNKTYLRVLSFVLQFLQIESFSSLDSVPVIATSSGNVAGIINIVTSPNVAQYLGVPYAEDPVGKLRFSPPVTKSPVTGIFSATKFGPSCPQYNTSTPTFFSVAAPEYYIEGPMAEECLSLNIWAPLWVFTNGTRKRNLKQQSIESDVTKPKLPVIIFLHGGQFTVGGSRVAYHKGDRWVERSQSHVLVTINYRLNIFGFPNARNLNSPSSNLGFLDQRLAVKWVQSNIAAFGGDPARMTLFGQSAGAVAVDAYNLAYPEDPVVTGLIMNSGTALLGTISNDRSQSNFTFVAQNLGCKNSTADAELECVRRIPYQKIEAFLKEYQDSGKRPAITFVPVQDDITFFKDPAARAKEGKLTRRPAIIGSAANEGASLARPYSPKGPPKQMIQAIGLGFLCGAVKTTLYRSANNLTTFFYNYAGNFSNISPLPWQGAYHSSELPLIFGQSEIVRGKSTPFEFEVGNRIQDLYVAFANYPYNLSARGWPEYRPGGNALVFGRSDQVTSLTPFTSVSAPCVG